MLDEHLPHPDVSGVLARVGQAAMQHTGRCANRNCRRHRRCRDIAAREPRCASLIETADFQRLRDAMHLALDIAEGNPVPPPSDDPEQRALEFGMLASMTTVLPPEPEITRRFAEWRKRHDTPAERTPPAPPPPLPAVPIDTSALLREVKAELDYARRIADIYDR